MKDFSLQRTQNRLLNVQEYESRSTRLVSRPRAVFVELTRNCNLRCFMCKPVESFQQGYNRDLDMPFSLFEQIAEELFPLAELVDLRGTGESTILKDFEKFFDYTVEYGCRVRLVSNLTTTDGDLLEKLVANDTFLAISLDATEKESYEYIRRGARFEQVMRNMERLREYRRKYRKSQDATIHMILYRRNLHQVEEMLRLAHKFEIGRVLIWPMELPASNGDNVIYHLEDANLYIQKGFALANELGIEMRIGDWFTRPMLPSKTLKNSVCLRPWMYLAIAQNGQVGYCDCYSEPPSLQGVRFADVPFEEIWNGQVYQNMRKAFATGIDKVAELDTGCSKCALRKLVDFDELFYPPFASRVVNNVQPELNWGAGDARLERD
jgi:MoaA/NifB/PqqE/SkfB family radical SAM enzyme